MKRDYPKRDFRPILNNAEEEQEEAIQAMTLGRRTREDVRRKEEREIKRALKHQDLNFFDYK